LKLVEVRPNVGYQGGWCAVAIDDAGKQTPRLSLGWFTKARD
jgi:hypothetical protein